MSYLENFKEEAKSTKLIFNDGKAGVVNDVKVQVVKKDDDSNKPDYSIYAYDKAQVENTGNVDEKDIYPVNKGYFKSNSYDSNKDYNGNREANNFTSEGAEQFAVNELKHLLKTFGHEITKNSEGLDIVVPKADISCYNDFLDYTMLFVKEQISNSAERFDVCVDYGSIGNNGQSYAKKYLQLNGFPWWIVKCGESIKNANNAILERPTPDSESQDTKTDDNDPNNW